MKPGQLITNAAKFPNAAPGGNAGSLTLFMPKSVATFGAAPPFVPLPLFAPTLQNTGFRTLHESIGMKDLVSGLPVGLGQITGQFPNTQQVYPPISMSYIHIDSAGNTESVANFDFKETQYMDVQNLLSGGDLLRITNMRFRYRLKTTSAKGRERRVWFFEQDIFGRPQIQQLTLAQYFDPATNKSFSVPAPFPGAGQIVETIDVPVDFFASASSGVCLEIPYLDCDTADFYNVTFMVQRYFNHVGRNKSILGN